MLAPARGEGETDPGGRQAAVDQQAGAERELAERVGGRESSTRSKPSNH